MNKVLYIQASPRKARSRSIQAADAFVEAYRQNHPEDSVEVMNLFETNLPHFDGPAVEAKYVILHGREHTAEQRRIWRDVEKVIEHFKDADQYVFAVPMWNFGIPWRLKQYIDLLVQPGYTFRVGENGYEGLVTGKPAIVFYARGGRYSDDQASVYDQQKPYFEQILRFMGFEKIHSVVVEPTLAEGPEKAKEVLEQALIEARRAAEMWT